MLVCDSTVVAGDCFFNLAQYVKGASAIIPSVIIATRILNGAITASYCLAVSAQISKNLRPIGPGFMCTVFVCECAVITASIQSDVQSAASPK